MVKNKIIIILLIFLCIPLTSYAAVTNLIGFETGTLTFDINALSGTGNANSGTVNTGTYSFEANPTTVNTGFINFGIQYLATGQMDVSTSIGTNTFTCFYFDYATKPTVNYEEIFRVRTGGGSDKFFMGLDSSGKLIAYDSTAAPIATSTTVLSSGTWYQLCIKVGTGAAGAYELKINGVSEFSGTASLTVTAAGSISMGKINNRNGNGVDYFFDDISVDTAAYNPGVVKQLIPNAAGTTNNWTGGTNASDWNEVKQIPSDADTTYVKSITANDVALFNVTDTATAGITGTVSGVKVISIERDEGGVSGLQTELSSSGVVASTTTNDPAAAYVQRGKIVATDPNTSAAWTLAGVDAVQVGILNTLSIASRMTSEFLQVLYTPAAAVTGAPSPVLLISGTLYLNGRVNTSN